MLEVNLPQFDAGNVTEDAAPADWRRALLDTLQTPKLGLNGLRSGPWGIFRGSPSCFVCLATCLAASVEMAQSKIRKPGTRIIQRHQPGAGGARVAGPAVERRAGSRSPKACRRDGT